MGMPGGGRGRGRGKQPLNKSLVKCFYCHKLGHLHYECPQWESKANFSKLEEEEELLLLAYVEEQKATRDEVWFLDSGCSYYMSGDQEWFTELDEEFKHSVKLGNDSRIVVTGNRSVHMKINGVIQVISNVYYIPELKNNMLSVGQLQEKGLVVLIQNGTCNVYYPRKGVIMHSDISGNIMFYLIAEKIPK